MIYSKSFIYLVLEVGVEPTCPGRARDFESQGGTIPAPNF